MSPIQRCKIDGAYKCVLPLTNMRPFPCPEGARWLLSVLVSHNRVYLYFLVYDSCVHLLHIVSSFLFLHRGVFGHCSPFGRCEDRSVYAFLFEGPLGYKYLPGGSSGPSIYPTEGNFIVSSISHVKTQRKAMSKLINRDFPGKPPPETFFFFVAKKIVFFIFSNFPKKSQKYFSTKLAVKNFWKVFTVNFIEKFLRFFRKFKKMKNKIFGTKK